MTPQHLRQIADRTGLDGIAEALREAADEIERLSGWKSVMLNGLTESETDATASVAGIAATQPAEVTDEQIKSVADAIPGAWRSSTLIQFARAILALRPVQVPMTDLPEGDVTYFDGRGDAVDGYTAERVWEILRSHGITAQAKKETP